MTTLSTPRPGVRRFTAVVLAALLCSVVPSPAAAQAGAVATPPAGRAGLQTPPPMFPADAPDAARTRTQLMALLKQYPPELGHILKLDPSLLNNDAYLAPYPGLVAFLAQHPEVKRNAGYFFDRIDSYGGGYTQSDAMRMWDGLIGDVGGLLIFVLVLGALGWTVRTLVDYRRWNRLSKTQTEAHTKLLDRFTANDELLAYVQSPAGSRFLQSAPIALDAGGRALSAPFGRILWSVQAGLVAAAGGFGLLYVSGKVAEEVTQPLYTLGALAVSLGIGFVLSAVVSYVLSRRLGLFDAAPATPGDRRDTRDSHAG